MVAGAMLCELNICVDVLPIFFESYVVRPYLSDWAALKFVVGTEHVIEKLRSYVYVYEREICQNAVCNVHKMDQLDQLLRCELPIIDLLSVHCKNNISYYFICSTNFTECKRYKDSALNDNITHQVT